MGDFTIRIIKGWRGRQIERSWSNTYEVMAGTEGPVELETMAQAIVTAEQQLHLTDVQFLEYTISTWEPDSQPYNPETFVTVGLAVAGLRGGGGGITPNALDYNVCMMVHRNAVTGRTGRVYYRGVLSEDDVQMGGDGRFTFTVPSGATGAPFTAYQAALAPYTGAGLDPLKLALISVSGATTYRRPIISWTPGGVVVNKKNHKWFDRA